MVGKPKTLHLTRVVDPAHARLEAWVQLAVTSQRLLRRVEQMLAQQDVTLPQFDVLSNLLMRDALTQQELAERLQVTKGNVCGLIDRLEKIGWVKRTTDTQDRRINRLSLTTAGRKRIEALRPMHDVLAVQMFQGLSNEEVTQLHRMLRSLDEQNDQTSTLKQGAKDVG